jgi:hypothetical protein
MLVLVLALVRVSPMVEVLTLRPMVVLEIAWQRRPTGLRLQL